jgi:hypothetical protein
LRDRMRVDDDSLLLALATTRCPRAGRARDCAPPRARTRVHMEFCAQHRSRGADRLGPDPVVRRVRGSCELLTAPCSRRQALASGVSASAPARSFGGRIMNCDVILSINGLFMTTRTTRSRCTRNANRRRVQAVDETWQA